MDAVPESSGKSEQNRSGFRGAQRQFEPEILYRFWADAGGKVAEAIRLAREAGEERVPLKPHTWAAYASRHHFSERLEQEEREKREKIHALRDKREQEVFDALATSFEEIALTYAQILIGDIASLHGKHDDQALITAVRRLNKLFPTIDSFDRYFRLYLRVRRLPEHLSQLTNVTSESKAVSYEELEREETFAPSIEDVRRERAEEGL